MKCHFYMKITPPPPPSFLHKTKRQPQASPNLIITIPSEGQLDGEYPVTGSISISLEDDGPWNTLLAIKELAGSKVKSWLITQRSSKNQNMVNTSICGNRKHTYQNKIKCSLFGIVCNEIHICYNNSSIRVGLHEIVTVNTPGAYCIKLLPEKNSGYFNRSFLPMVKSVVNSWLPEFSDFASFISGKVLCNGPQEN